MEESFAILKTTFLELGSPCLLDIELVPQMIGACCVLHNILIDRNDIKTDEFEFGNARPASTRGPEGAFSGTEKDLLDGDREALIKRDTSARS